MSIKCFKLSNFNADALFTVYLSQKKSSGEETVQKLIKIFLKMSKEYFYLK